MRLNSSVHKDEFSEEKLPVVERDGVKVMRSMDLAKICETRHDDFLRKVPKVLGIVARNFTGYYKAKNGKENPCYFFPERESCLMAMSYSYELQAKIYDRWKDLETGQAKPVLESFSPLTGLAPVARDKKALAEVFGLSGNQALLSAAKATEEVTGCNPIALLGIELKSNSKEKVFTPTELGKAFFDGMSGRKVNSLLEKAGLQEKIEGQWELTEMGQQYAEVFDTGRKHNSGVPVKQVKWFKSVTSLLEKSRY